jgi:hypothetical protein
VLPAVAFHGNAQTDNTYLSSIQHIILMPAYGCCYSELRRFSPTSGRQKRQSALPSGISGKSCGAAGHTRHIISAVEVARPMIHVRYNMKETTLE